MISQLNELRSHSTGGSVYPGGTCHKVGKAPTVGEFMDKLHKYNVMPLHHALDLEALNQAGVNAQLVKDKFLLEIENTHLR